MGSSNRVLFGVLCALPTLVGCQLSRPEGVYDFIEPEAGAPLVEFPEDELDSGSPVVVLPPGDGAMPGAEIPEPANALYKDLVGTYLMRFDEETFTQSSSGGIVSVTISATSTVSRFVLGQIEERDGKLKSREWLCHQTNATVCSSDCKSAVTKIHPNAMGIARRTAFPFERELTLGEATGELRASSATIYLGYDAKDDKQLPTSTNDARVWDPDAVRAGREGFYTDVSITIDAGLTKETVRCQLSLVQKFSMDWLVPSVKSGATYSLEGKQGSFEVQSTRADTKILDALGSSSSANCKDDSPPDVEQRLPNRLLFRFYSKERVFECPSLTDFEGQLRF